MVTRAHSTSPALPPSAGRDRWGLPKSAVTYREVSSHTEAQLFYPGSHLIQRFGGPEQEVAFAGRSAAFAGGVLSSDADPGQIYAWYRDWLLARGWHSRDMGRLSTWKSGEGYARNTRERFSVAIDDPHLLSLAIGRHLPEARTLYEISYTILPYKGSHP